MAKKIGFVDYYISEWHANHYPEWIGKANESLGTDYEVAYAWAELDTSPLDGVTTQQWCEKFGAEQCKTIAELCKKSDYIIVLAPSDPDKHLQYARQVLPFGKRTYIDKTFAPDYPTAKAIFDLAEKYGTPFFSSSALRYADELKELRELGQLRSVVITGGGGNFNEYNIHLVEMAVALLNAPAEKVKVEAVGNQRICRVVSTNGSEAALIYSIGYNYTLMAIPVEGKFSRKVVASEFFVNLLRDIIHFFETGEKSFDSAQTLQVMAVRDALLQAEMQDGQWVTL